MMTSHKESLTLLDLFKKKKKKISRTKKKKYQVNETFLIKYYVFGFNVIRVETILI